MHHRPNLSRASWRVKIGLVAVLVGVADLLLWGHEPGATLGLFCATVLAGLLTARRGVLRERRGLLAVLAAAAFAVVLIDRPGPLAWMLFWLSAAVTALSARVRTGETAWGWAQRILVAGIVGLFGPLIELFRVMRFRGRGWEASAGGLLLRLVMPVFGGLVFLVLFAAANPLISDFIDNFALPTLLPDVVRVIFWGAVTVVVMAVLRPRWRNRLVALPTRKVGTPSAALTTSITWSLVVFNAVFALQNGLDIAFLWSGAPLPGDMGLADYAHRGAYPLIVTALLAGLFVLVALQPGSDTAKRPLVRWLVVAWIAQNMLLVASSLLRTVDYVEAYALTGLRIAAMIWMVMVAAGLILICWRMLRDKSAHWLINANVAMTLAVLAVSSAVDFGAVASAWNVRHARELGGRGVALDLGYLHSIGEPALVSLVEVEQSTDDPDLRDRAAAVRIDIFFDVRKRQGDWHSWTWRAARRLDRVEALTAHRPLTPPKSGEREWNGALSAPDPQPVAVATPPIVSPPPPAALTSATGG